ncbi:hypothetical protein JXB11_00995 [Candidatus Woesearchaeota archaeon]|nr:hypothetical protein [Candidatus Woesearchaeota archaeon]
MAKKENKNEFSSIAGTVGGVTVGMIALIVIFASENAWVIAPVVAFMAVMGMTLGYFASRKR